MKIRLEITDNKGTKTVAEVEGKMGYSILEKAVNLMQEMIFLSFESSSPIPKGMNSETLTIKERIEGLLKYEAPKGWFTSMDVKRQYEERFGSIKLSTVSTYLSKMYEEGILERRGNRSQREYRIASLSDAGEDIPNSSPEFIQ
ncbi:MAG: hypothetical protein ACXQS7_04705 [Candidatus Syntropharchaeia archaeon]